LDLEISRVRNAYSRRDEHRERQLYTCFNEAFLYHAQERERKILQLLRRAARSDLRSMKILEVGCEKGRLLVDLIRWGARPENLCAVDILPEHVNEAKRICPGSVAIHAENAASLSFPDATFDLVVQGTTFSSIPTDEGRAQAAREMLRVLRPTGTILWYDFSYDNPRNPDVRGLDKRDIRGFFPGCRVTLKRVTLAPPLARLIAPRSRFFFEALTELRFLSTHYVGLIAREH
jgi:SAM-dependent methyltransferase